MPQDSTSATWAGSTAMTRCAARAPMTTTVPTMTRSIAVAASRTPSPADAGEVAPARVRGKLQGSRGHVLLLGRPAPTPAPASHRRGRLGPVQNAQNPAKRDQGRIDVV